MLNDTCAFFIDFFVEEARKEVLEIILQKKEASIGVNIDNIDKLLCELSIFYTTIRLSVLIDRKFYES